MEGPQIGSIELTDVQKFYKDSTVFLTGATGFIGKLFLEKVLRALPVKRVYILMRAKKDVPATKRFDDIFLSPVFDRLKRSSPDVFDKVVIIKGDCSLSQLALSEKDVEIIIREVNMIFHCAAAVRFDEHIKKITYCNVRAIKDLVDLAKRIKNLKAFVYVGTGFSNCNSTEIREEVYPAKITADKLIAACDSLDEACLAKVASTLIGDWPNNYTFTKQVAEDYINREGKGIPIAIARPTIVTSTAAEPMVAFVDNPFTLAGFVLLNGLGISRITHYRNINMPIIPVDYVINECIAIGWQTGVMFKKQQVEIPVYNITTSIENRITQDQLYDLCDFYGRQTPALKTVAYPLYFRTTCKYNYLIGRFFLHTLIAYIMDFILRIRGQKPGFAEKIKKLHTFQKTYEFFVTKEFFFHVDNTQKLLKRMSFEDRRRFNFDTRGLNWENYFAQYPKGLRYYLLKDSMDTIPDAIKKYAYLKKVLIVTCITFTVIVYALIKVFLFRILPPVCELFKYLLGNILC